MEKPGLEQRFPLTLDFWKMRDYVLEKHGKDIQDWDGKQLFRDHLALRDEGEYYSLSDADQLGGSEWLKQIYELLFAEFEDCLVKSYDVRLLHIYFG